jgi:CHAD domain-containing protein
MGELREARARVGEWRLGGEGVDALAPGFGRIYRRGRRAYRIACREPSTENLHELRKRAKDLWYAAQVVRRAAPKKLRRLTRRSHELADLLGEEHDLALLAQRVGERRDLFEDATAADELTALVERRRDELRREALRLGRRLYRKKPRKVVKVLETSGAAS